MELQSKVVSRNQNSASLKNEWKSPRIPLPSRLLFGDPSFRRRNWTTMSVAVGAWTMQRSVQEIRIQSGDTSVRRVHLRRMRRKPKQLLES